MEPTAGHELKSESDAAMEANKITDEIENPGTEILDAACSPSNIKYPQDFELTALSEIALSVLVTNLFSADIKDFFILYFMPDYGYEKKENYIIFDDEV